MTCRHIACVLLVALTGCSATEGFASDGGLCAVATSCSDVSVPSYQAVIVPILQNACIGCHSPSGVAGKSETTYLDVYNQREPMLSQLAGCVMPPPSGPGGAPVTQLTTEERITLTSWLECGAPNN
jgi:uncharacterized membrane protein